MCVDRLGFYKDIHKKMKQLIILASLASFLYAGIAVYRNGLELQKNQDTTGMSSFFLKEMSAYHDGGHETLRREEYPAFIRHILLKSMSLKADQYSHL